jgi:hypothetical protein
MNINFDKVPKYVTNEVSYSGDIARGARGSRVERVQEWLAYHSCRTSIDGGFGPATEACVLDFQKKKSLKLTGKVDEATWLALVGPMREALAEPVGVASMKPASAVKKVAQQHLKQHPIELGGDNCGPWVRLYCKGNDGRAWAWCAGFVSLVMAQAYFYMGKDKPIEGSVSCDILATQGKAAERFVHESEVAKGKWPWADFGGCGVFLRRRTDTDWTHTGFALGGSGDTGKWVFDTIEGNTNDEGSREGFEACKRKRSLAGYDFIHIG